MTIRVLLADDTQMMRRAIRRLLADHREVEVVGEAENLAQTLQMMEALSPQVTVMDLYLQTEEHLDGEVTPEWHRATSGDFSFERRGSAAAGGKPRSGQTVGQDGTV